MATLDAILVFLLPAAAVAAPPPAPEHRLSSPDGRIEVVVRGGERLAYDVTWSGKPMLAGATLSLDVDHTKLGVAPKIVAVRQRSVDARVEPPVRLKQASLVEKYNELRLECAGHYAVVFRAYDAGVGYRFETTLPAKSVKVFGEEATFPFAVTTPVYFPNEGKTFFSHNEQHYTRVPLGQLPAGDQATLPVVVETPAGPKLAIAEADVDGYPGLWLRAAAPALAAVFPPYPLEEKAVKDRDVKVTKAADYIAVTRGTRTYPWRVLAVAATDADLITNPLVYLLQRPSELKDPSWIKPGKVAWDWWNDRNLQGVSFKPGINTDTYKYFIDFASKNGIEYLVFDEGWYEIGNVTKVVPQLDMPALLAHAKQKKVGIILWVVWKTFADQLEPALALYQKWGVKGLKIDFMQRDDQPMIDFYHRVAREVGKRRMLVDFHGGQRPALMTRTWPNIISTEGVMGLEHVKWSNATDPEHDVTLPFTRMLLGPMDYTPGAMLNAQKSAFKIEFKRPMSMGTRTHQLAMYVVFESPLQMLADSPTNYEHEPESTEFIARVPTVWDETRVLDAKLGDYVIVARRRGADWYLGGMTDWTARDFELPLSFLPSGGPPSAWTMTAFSDGADADRVGASYRRTTSVVDHDTKLRFHLAPGGGVAARFTRLPSSP